MGSYSLLRLSFVISLCIHFSLGFLPLFTLSQTHQSPSKFLEVVFSKARESRILDRAKSCTFLQDIPVRGESTLKPRPGYKRSGTRALMLDEKMRNEKETQERGYNETNSESIIIAEQFELDLVNLEGNWFSNSFFNYAHLLRACIQNEIIYPLPAFSQNIQGTVQLKFILLPDGSLKDIYIVESSNYSILDTAAINAIEKANPFPPFPRNLRAKELFVKVPVIYKLN